MSVIGCEHCLCFELLNKLVNGIEMAFVWIREDLWVVEREECSQQGAGL